MRHYIPYHILTDNGIQFTTPGAGGSAVPLIKEAIAATAAASMKEMGKVMGWLKPRVQGRADIGALSARIKTALGG